MVRPCDEANGAEPRKSLPNPCETPLSGGVEAAVQRLGAPTSRFNAGILHSACTISRDMSSCGQRVAASAAFCKRGDRPGGAKPPAESRGREDRKSVG